MAELIRSFQWSRFATLRRCGSDFVAGGYLAVPRADRAAWQSDLLPEQFVTVSECLTGVNHGPGGRAWHTDPHAARQHDGRLLLIPSPRLTPPTCWRRSSPNFDMAPRTRTRPFRSACRCWPMRFAFLIMRNCAATSCLALNGLCRAFTPGFVTAVRSTLLPSWVFAPTGWGCSLRTRTRPLCSSGCWHCPLSVRLNRPIGQLPLSLAVNDYSGCAP